MCTCMCMCACVCVHRCMHMHLHLHMHMHMHVHVCVHAHVHVHACAYVCACACACVHPQTIQTHAWPKHCTLLLPCTHAKHTDNVSQMIIVVRTTGVAGVNSTGMAGNAEAGTNGEDSSTNEAHMHVRGRIYIYIYIWVRDRNAEASEKRRHALRCSLGWMPKKPRVLWVDTICRPRLPNLSSDMAHKDRGK